MEVSVAVMAHPSRAAFVDELLPQLPGAVVVWDQKGDRWDTGRRCMLAHPSTARWGLTVQDDALLCPHFLEIATAQLESLGLRNDGPVSFYCGALRSSRMGALMRDAAHRRDPWARYPGPHWGVAVAVRTVEIERMVEHCDGLVSIPNYDRRMSRYFERERGHLCRYSAPSIADHRTHGNPSLVAGRGWRGRKALWYEDDPRAVWARERPPRIGIQISRDAVHAPAHDGQM